MSLIGILIPERASLKLSRIISASDASRLRKVPPAVGLTPSLILSSISGEITIALISPEYENLWQM